MCLLHSAIASREVGRSCVHSESSRSHMVIRFIVRTMSGGSGVVGGLTLVDLAGNEREGESFTPGRKEQSTAINVSLTHLNRMLVKMQEGKLDESDRRQSALNMVLFEQLREDCGVTMIFCIHPERRHASSARSTLQMAMQCRRIIQRKRVRRLESLHVQDAMSQSLEELAGLRSEASALSQVRASQLLKDEELLKTTELLRDLKLRYEEKSKDYEGLRKDLETEFQRLAEEGRGQQELVAGLEHQVAQLQMQQQQLQQEDTLELPVKAQKAMGNSSISGACFDDHCHELEKAYREQLREVHEAYGRQLQRLQEAMATSSELPAKESLVHETSKLSGSYWEMPERAQSSAGSEPFSEPSIHSVGLPEDADETIVCWESEAARTPQRSEAPALKDCFSPENTKSSLEERLANVASPQRRRAARECSEPVTASEDDSLAKVKRSWVVTDGCGLIAEAASAGPLPVLIAWSPETLGTMRAPAFGLRPGEGPPCSSPPETPQQTPQPSCPRAMMSAGGSSCSRRLAAAFEKFGDSHPSQESPAAGLVEQGISRRAAGATTSAGRRTERALAQVLAFGRPSEAADVVATEASLAQLARFALQDRLEQRLWSQCAAAAIRAMRLLPRSLQAQRDGAILLSELAGKDASMKEDVVSRGALALSVAALHWLSSLASQAQEQQLLQLQHQQLSEACSGCFRLLAVLCQRNQELQATVSELGGLHASLACLSRPALRRGLDPAIHGCWLLMAVCYKHPANQDLVRAAGGVALVLQLLGDQAGVLEAGTSHNFGVAPPEATRVVETQSATLCAYAAGFLASVAEGSDASREVIFNGGGVGILLRALETCLQSPHVVANACVAVAHLAYLHEPSQRAARAQGGVVSIIGALLAYRGRGAVQGSICRAIAVLSEGPCSFNQQAFLAARLPDGAGETDVVALLLQALHGAPEDPALVTTASWALANLVRESPEACERLRAQRGCETIVSLLNGPVARQERPCQYLCRLLGRLCEGGTQFAHARRNRITLLSLGAADLIRILMTRHELSQGGEFLSSAREALRYLEDRQ
ncbi:unnamed protein product [Polarella glacialis]|uniref:Kinesin motor domain-containing protein n=1 Tax=Polarella glacialis TaxID=89957 RepID=A0A813M0L1_POLGL|nr:unnamed protein product [Polarella glacialis]